jgi:hypothetical protein
MCEPGPRAVISFTPVMEETGLLNDLCMFAGFVGICA